MAAGSVTLAQLAVDLDLNTRKWTAGFRDAGRDLQRFQGQVQRAGSGFQRIFEVAAGIGAFQAFQKGVAYVKQFADASVQAAGRVEEMDAVLQILGRNSGVTRGAIDDQIASIKELGIQTRVAQESLADFMRYNLDASKAAELARAAQDVAVLGAMDSSQTLDRLMWGIITRQPEVIRTAGLTVNFEQAFSRAAAESNKAAGALSEQEKVQAALNAVLKEAATLEGAYEAAMTSATKQVRSRERYVAQLQETMGALFLPVWSEWQFAINDIIKDITKVFDSSGPVAQPIIAFATRIATIMSRLRESFQLKFDLFVGGDGLQRIGEWIDLAIQKAQEFRGVFTAIFVKFASSGLSRMLGVLAGFTLPPGLREAAAIFAALVVSSDQFRDALMDLGRSAMRSFGIILSAFDPVVAALQDLIEAAAPALARIVSAIADVLPQVATVAASLISALAPLIEVATTVLVPIINAVASLIEWLGKLKISVALVTAALALWTAHKVTDWVGKISNGLTSLTGLLRSAAQAWTAMGTAAEGAAVQQLRASSVGAKRTLGLGPGGWMSSQPFQQGTEVAPGTVADVTSMRSIDLAAKRTAEEAGKASAAAVEEGALGTIVGNTIAPVGSAGEGISRLGSTQAIKEFAKSGDDMARAFAKSSGVDEAAKRLGTKYMDAVGAAVATASPAGAVRSMQQAALLSNLPASPTIGGMDIQEFVTQHQAGFTVDPWSGTQPTKGYAVAPWPEMSMAMPASALGTAAGRQQMQAWMQQVSGYLAMPGNYMGGWLDQETGQYVFDVSRVEDKLSAGKRLGYLADQKAIYDIGAGEEIPTYGRGRGTGLKIGPAGQVLPIAYQQPAFQGAAAMAASGQSVRAVLVDPSGKPIATQAAQAATQTATQAAPVAPTFGQKASAAYRHLGLGTGAPMVDLALVGIVGSLVVAWQQVSKAQDEATKKAEAYGDSVLAIFGAMDDEAPIERRLRALEQLRARASEAQREWEQVSPPGMEEHPGLAQWDAQIREMTGPGAGWGTNMAMAAADTVAGWLGKDLPGWLQPKPAPMQGNEGITDTDTVQRTAAEAEAYKDYWRDFWKETVDIFAEGTAEAVSKVDEMLSQIKDSEEQFEAEFNFELNLESMSPAQAKVVTDQLDQIREATKQWAPGVTNAADDLMKAWEMAQERASRASKDGNIVLPEIDLADFQASAQEAGVLVTNFRRDLNQLTRIATEGGVENIGNMILDLMKAGPEKVGPALSSFVDQLLAMSADEAQRFVEGQVETWNRAQKEIELLFMDQALALSEGEIKIDSAESAAQFAEDKRAIDAEVEAAGKGVQEIIPQLSALGASVSGSGKKYGPQYSSQPGATVAGAPFDEEPWKSILADAERYANEATVPGKLAAEEVVGWGQSLQARIQAATETANLSDESKKLVEALQNELTVLMELGPAYNDYANAMSEAAAAAGRRTVGTPSAIEEQQGVVEGLQTVRGQMFANVDAETGQILDDGTREEIEAQLRSLGAVGVEALGKIEASNWDAAKSFTFLAQAIAAAKGALSDLKMPMELPDPPKIEGIDEDYANLDKAIEGVRQEIDGVRQAATQATEPVKTAAQEAAEAAQKARQEWDDLKGAISEATAVATAPTLGRIGLAEDAKTNAEIMGRALTGFDKPADAMRNIERMSAQATQSIADYALALAEAGVIGRDQASITAKMSEEAGKFIDQLRAETDEWLRNNQAKVAATKVAEELAKTWGRTRAVMTSTRDVGEAIVGVTKAVLSVGSVRITGLRDLAMIQNSITDATLEAIDAIEAEAYALAEAGQIGKTTGDILTYIQGRVSALGDEIKSTNADLLTLNERLGLFSQAWDSILGPILGAEQAAINTRSALDALTKTMQQQLGIAVSESTPDRDAARAWDAIKGSLMSYVEAVKQEAIAMAQAGEIANDYGSILAYIQERLAPLAAQFPALAESIQNYIGAMDQIPEQVDTQVNLAVNAAMQAVNSYKASLGQIPPEVWTTALVNDYWAKVIVYSLLTDTFAKIPEYIPVRIDVDAEQAINNTNAMIERTDALIAKLNQLTAERQALQNFESKHGAAFTASYLYYTNPTRANLDAAWKAMAEYGAAARAIGRDPNYNKPDLAAKAAADWALFDNNPATAGTAIPFALGSGSNQSLMTWAKGGIQDEYGNVITPQAIGDIVPKAEVPQIAPAGRYVLWAETSTQGEAYIPFAKAVRGRAEAILSDVARRFGGAYLPGGKDAARAARAMEQGGIVERTSTSEIERITEMANGGVLDVQHLALGDVMGGNYLPGDRPSGDPLHSYPGAGMTGPPISDTTGFFPVPEGVDPGWFHTELAKGLNLLMDHPLLVEYRNLTLPPFDVAYNQVLPLDIPPWLAEELRYQSMLKLQTGMPGHEVVPAAINYMVAEWNRRAVPQPGWDRSDWFMASGEQVLSRHVVSDTYVGVRDTPEHKVDELLQDPDKEAAFREMIGWIGGSEERAKQFAAFAKAEQDKADAFARMNAWIGGDPNKAAQFAAFAQAQQDAFDRMTKFLSRGGSAAKDWSNFVVSFRELGGVDVPRALMPQWRGLPPGMDEQEAYGTLSQADYRPKLSIPMIAPAGANILWAEKSTGGEAYIPFAQGIRSRAEGLMSQVAAIFGGAYLPAHQVRKEVSGVAPPSIGGSASSVTPAAAGWVRFGPNDVRWTRWYPTSDEYVQRRGSWIDRHAHDPYAGPPGGIARGGLVSTSERVQERSEIRERRTESERIMQAIEGDAERIIIEQLIVQTTAPPRDWLEELSWRRIVEGEI